MGKTLCANNPQAPHNICTYSFKDRVYKVDDNVDMLTFHHSFDGNLMKKETEEA
jgi:dynein intermediate chain 1